MKETQDHLTTKTTDQRYLTGMFRDRDSAENVYNDLIERGYTKDEINLIMSDDTRKGIFRANMQKQK
jgi:hypothetical protein